MHCLSERRTERRRSRTIGVEIKAVMMELRIRESSTTSRR
jgi:hypothetical protein